MRAVRRRAFFSFMQGTGQSEVSLSVFAALLMPTWWTGGQLNMQTCSTGGSRTSKYIYMKNKVHGMKCLRFLYSPSFQRMMMNHFLVSQSFVWLFFIIVFIYFLIFALNFSSYSGKSTKKIQATFYKCICYMPYEGVWGCTSVSLTFDPKKKGKVSQLIRLKSLLSTNHTSSCLL